MSSQSAIRYRTHLAGICVIALAVLAYQVLLTRIFSVMLYYHFAFAGISLAMLGMTVGAQKVYLNKERFSPQRLEKEWAKAALGFSISSIVLAIVFLYAPPQVLMSAALFLLILLFVVPFTYAGICVTLILTKSPAPVGKLYAADLIGAALGSMGIATILFVLDPVTLMLALAMLTALAAWLMARKLRRLALFSGGVTVLWLMLAVLHGALYLTGAPHLGIVWAKGAPRLDDTLFERWNAFSLVRVRPYSNEPFGWGFGHAQTKPGPDQLMLDIDAQAGTVISRFDGKNLKPFSYLGDDVINMAYQVHPVQSAAIIGLGGGRDILSALYFGTPHITGIELNPAIFEALTRRFDDFSGHLERRPEVKLVNAEARSWLVQNPASFDLIQISLIDTWAATAAGGLALSENKLYTTDAWKSFMDHLTPGGMLSVSRWFDPISHKGEFYRLLSLAAETIRHRGVAPAEIDQHVMAFSSDKPAVLRDATPAGVVTVVVSPAPFTAVDVTKALRVAKKAGFHVLLAPGMAWDDVSRTIIAGAGNTAFYDTLPLDVSPPSDDRPFFFNMMRPRDLFSQWKRFGSAAAKDDVNVANNAATGITLGLLIATLASLVYFTAIPMLETWRRLRDKAGMFPHLGYFAAIGLGFMLIEISQLQRLMIFLGHPIYGLTVVLFTLLLSGGVGSAAVGIITEKNKKFPRWLPPVVLCVVLAATGTATPFATATLAPYGTGIRIFASALALAPAGFFMGMMFPLGMVASKPYEALQSWFWSVNGATSVFGSVLGVVLSMEYGITAAFWTGVLCYIFCALLVLRRVP